MTHVPSRSDLRTNVLLRQVLPLLRKEGVGDAILERAGLRIAPSGRLYQAGLPLPLAAPEEDIHPLIYAALCHAIIRTMDHDTDGTRQGGSPMSWAHYFSEHTEGSLQVILVAAMTLYRVVGPSQES
jgi:hypothetical protein